MELNLSFWPEHEAATCVTCIQPECVARPWCDPARHIDVVGVDFGKGKVHAYWCSTGRKKKAEASSARHLLLSLPEGTLVVGEWAHLAVPRKRTSLAQPFTAEELLHLYAGLRSRGVTLKLFPHAHSGTRAMGWAACHFNELAGAKKTDANDAMAIALYVKHCNGVSLANPPQSFAICNRRNYGLAVAKQANIVLNAERSGGYRGKTFRHIINLSVAIGRKANPAFGRIALVSIAALIATEIKGKPCIYVRDGKPPGAWLWARHVARMTPFHHYAGIARSNLMRHTFRPFFKAYARDRGVVVGVGPGYFPFGQHSQEQRAIRTEAMRAFRRAVIDAYRLGVEIALQRGFQKLDVVAHQEAEKHGR